MLEYKDLKGVDLKLTLLSGSEIKIGNLVIKPYTLGEIKDYGYTNYMTNLQLLSISLEDFITSVDDIEKRVILEQQKMNLKTLDFFISFGGEELLEAVLKSLSMIFRTEDVRVLDNNNGVIAIDFVKKGIFKVDEYDEIEVNHELLDSLSEDEITVVTRYNFDELVEAIKLQNYLEKPKEQDEEEQYADEATRKLMEDMKRHRKRVEEKKKAQQQSDGNDIDLSDIISAVSSKSNSINKLNVWQFTLYQIYDEYSRLELIDNYDFSIQAMMNGAEKVDLKHWSSRI